MKTIWKAVCVALVVSMICVSFGAAMSTASHGEDSGRDLGIVDMTVPSNPEKPTEIESEMIKDPKELERYISVKEEIPESSTDRNLHIQMLSCCVMKSFNVKLKVEGEYSDCPYIGLNIVCVPDASVKEIHIENFTFDDKFNGKLMYLQFESKLAENISLNIGDQFGLFGMHLPSGGLFGYDLSFSGFKNLSINFMSPVEAAGSNTDSHRGVIEFDSIENLSIAGLAQDGFLSGKDVTFTEIDEVDVYLPITSGDGIYAKESIKFEEIGKISMSFISGFGGNFKGIHAGNEISFTKVGSTSISVSNTDGAYGLYVDGGNNKDNEFLQSIAVTKCDDFNLKVSAGSMACGMALKYRYDSQIYYQPDDGYVKISGSTVCVSAFCNGPEGSGTLINTIDGYYESTEKGDKTGKIKINGYVNGVDLGYQKIAKGDSGYKPVDQDELNGKTCTIFGSLISISTEAPPTPTPTPVPVPTPSDAKDYTALCVMICVLAAVVVLSVLAVVMVRKK